MAETQPYEGPVCYVGHDHVAADGQQLEGGWHYTVVDDDDAKKRAVDHAEKTLVRGKRLKLKTVVRAAEDELEDLESRRFEKPGKKLFLDERDGTFRLARGADQSWHKRQHKQLVVVAPEGNIGVPATVEEFDAAHRHLDALEQRVTEGRLDAHERDHELTTIGEIHAVRGWLQRKEKP